MPKRTSLGLQKEQMKPSTGIYRVALPPPAHSRCETGLRVCPAPQSRWQRTEPRLEGTVLSICASTRGCWSCTCNPIVQQDLQRACWPVAGKMFLRDGTRSSSISCPAGSRRLQQKGQRHTAFGPLAHHHLQLETPSGGPCLGHLLPRQEIWVSPPKGGPPPRSQENQKQGYSKVKGGASGLGDRSTIPHNKPA